MRASIIAWSTLSGLLLGLFIDAVLLGGWLLLSTAFPVLAPRDWPRAAIAGGVILLAAIAAAGALLGFLEGRLKVG